jgi:hypothetical protein
MKDFSHRFRELVERELPSDPRVPIPGGGVLNGWSINLRLAPLVLQPVHATA